MSQWHYFPAPPHSSPVSAQLCSTGRRRRPRPRPNPSYDSNKLVPMAKFSCAAAAAIDPPLLFRGRKRKTRKGPIRGRGWWRTPLRLDQWRAGAESRREARWRGRRGLKLLAGAGLGCLPEQVLLRHLLRAFEPLRPPLYQVIMPWKNTFVFLIFLANWNWIR